MSRFPSGTDRAGRRPARFRADLICLLAASWAGCGGGGAGGDAAGPVVLSSSDVRVLGESESISVVRDLEVLRDGTVWLLNSDEPFVIGFDGDGVVIDEHGTTGGGPGQFGAPVSLVQGGLDGHAWALDVARHAYIRVSDPGEAVTEVPIPRGPVPPGSLLPGLSLLNPTVRTARLGDELLVPWVVATPDAGLEAFRLAILGADLAGLDPATGAVRNVLALRDVLGDLAEGFEATDGGFPLWYRLWSVCGDHIRVFDRVRNQLRGFTASGREIAPIELPPVILTEATPEEFARAVFPLRQAEVTGGVGERLVSADSARLVREMAQALNGQPEQLAAYLPRYVDFRCADDGVAWLQPVDLDRGGLKGSATWLRISPDGGARDVTLPARFDPLRFTTDRIWGVQRNALDVASVAWIELPAELRPAGEAVAPR